MPNLVTQQFIKKLYTMTSDPGTADVISFTPQGDSIIFNDVERLVSELLPSFFKHSNLSSFVRQLNSYGFSKIHPEKWIFHHAHFHSSRPDLLHMIQRKSSYLGAIVRPAPAAAEGGGRTGMELAVGGAGGGGEPRLSLELESLRTRSASMAGRIRELEQQVATARAKQSDTHAAIGKMMSFLSNVYNDSLRACTLAKHGGEAGGPSALGAPASAAHPAAPNAQQRRPLEVSDGLVDSASKRSRLMPPPAAVLATGVAAASGMGAAMPMPNISVTAAPPSSLAAPARCIDASCMPSLASRGQTLGAQCALALPSDLRGLALELVGSTDLQDEAMQEVLAGAPPGGYAEYLAQKKSHALQPPPQPQPQPQPQPPPQNARQQAAGEAQEPLQQPAAQLSPAGPSGSGAYEAWWEYVAAPAAPGEADAGAPQTPDAEVESYLWDFLETTQELEENESSKGDQRRQQAEAAGAGGGAGA